jgi:signal transduction histidine kinase
MKLQVKFAIYNALSKAVIVLAFGAILPLIVEKIVYNHTDKRLKARSEKVLKIIKLGGINDIIREQDCSFESYNILKEEFISITPVFDTRIDSVPEIFNEKSNIGGEILNHRSISLPFMYDNQMYNLKIGEGISTVEQLKSTISKFSLWAMIIVVLVSVFIDMGFVRLLLKPFNRIIETKLTQTLSPFSFRTDEIPSTTREFSYLDKSINSMMHKIKAAFLTEKEFIANVSHELQTPISIVQNRLENIIVDGNVNDEVAVKLIDSQRTLGRMSKIIKALLLISRIENDQYLKKDSINICGLLDEITEEIEERLQEKNITVIKEYADDFRIDPCNKTLLFTMFFNIINNAIKYNNENGTITISTLVENRKKIVRIKDSGIGISKEEILVIFDRFKRVHHDANEGYGLGLTIVKTVAGFHNISIDVSSEPGQGTLFTLSC